RLKLGEKKAQMLKELVGNIAVQVEGPSEPLVVIDNVLNAKGQTAKGKNNELLTLINIQKSGDNAYRVEFSMEANAPNAAVIMIFQLGGPGFGGGRREKTKSLPDLLTLSGELIKVKWRAPGPITTMGLSPRFMWSSIVPIPVRDPRPGWC